MRGKRYSQIRIPQMLQATEERRGTRRFTLRLPVALHLPKGEAEAHTKDVSARGIYFYCSGGTLDEGNPLDFTLTLSPQPRPAGPGRPPARACWAWLR